MAPLASANLPWISSDSIKLVSVKSEQSVGVTDIRILASQIGPQVPLGPIKRLGWSIILFHCTLSFLRGGGMDSCEWIFTSRPNLWLFVRFKSREWTQFWATEEHHDRRLRRELMREWMLISELVKYRGEWAGFFTSFLILLCCCWRVLSQNNFSSSTRWRKKGFFW